MARHQWSGRLRLRDDFRSRDVAVSWLVDCGAPGAAWSHADAESPRGDPRVSRSRRGPVRRGRTLAGAAEIVFELARRVPAREPFAGLALCDRRRGDRETGANALSPEYGSRHLS